MLKITIFWQLRNIVVPINIESLVLIWLFFVKVIDPDAKPENPMSGTKPYNLGTYLRTATYIMYNLYLRYFFILTKDLK